MTIENTYSYAIPRSVHQLSSDPHPALKKDDTPSVWGGDGFGADDFLDLVNPLQHIPVVSHLYRAATGDTISVGARLIGGGVLGGIPGLASSTATILAEEVTGTDIGDVVTSALEPDHTDAALFAPDTGVNLEPDNGMALLEVAQAYHAEAIATPKTDAEKEKEQVGIAMDFSELRAPDTTQQDQYQRSQRLADQMDVALKLIS